MSSAWGEEVRWEYAWDSTALWIIQRESPQFPIDRERSSEGDFVVRSLTGRRFVPLPAAGRGGDWAVVLHQDSFAAAYNDDEYTLLGMAVKYAGLKGVTLNIIGKNHETF